MAKVLISDLYLTDIAGAIRAKNGTSTTYTPAQMKLAILNIPLTSPTVQLSDIVLRPDATVILTYTYDKMINADNELDEGVTFPTYSTTSVTLKASTDLTPTLTLDTDNYNYYIVERFLSIPIYNITSKGKGRVEYAVSSLTYEVVDLETSDFKALLNGTTCSAVTPVITSVGSAYRNFYWSSSSALTIYSTSSYGPLLVAVTPTISTSKVLTLKSPNMTIRGNTSYYTSTYFNATTDIRYQYVIQVYRAPKSTLNKDGWNITQGVKTIVDCVNNNNKKLV